MNSNKWTPGPWKWNVETYAPVEGQIEILGEAGENVSKIPTHYPNNTGNALLIAAAPELYEALAGFFAQDIACPFGMNDGRLKDWQEWYEKARAALAKARGDNESH